MQVQRNYTITCPLEIYDSWLCTWVGQVHSQLIFNTKCLNLLTENHTVHQLLLTHMLEQKHFLVYHVFAYSSRPLLFSLKIMSKTKFHELRFFWELMKSTWIAKYINFNFLAIEDQISKIYLINNQGHCGEKQRHYSKSLWCSWIQHQEWSCSRPGTKTIPSSVALGQAFNNWLQFLPTCKKDNHHLPLRCV